LDAIAEQTEAPDEVIVVDNNSVDRTAEIAKSYQFVTVVKETKQGRVYARNRGFNMIQNDIIARIDADTILPESWVAHVRRFYENPAHTGTAWTSGAKFYNVPCAPVVNAVYNCLSFWLDAVLLGHRPLWGSNMALPRAMWHGLRYQLCERNDIHEDVDIAIHAHQAGFKIHYDSRMKVGARLQGVVSESEHEQLREMLQWLPRAMRVHGNPLWPVNWLFGYVLLYGVAHVFGALTGPKVLRRQQSASDQSQL
jgi:glycosyltransferase involved in cell wall biosynthesis